WKPWLSKMNWLPALEPSLALSTIVPAAFSPTTSVWGSPAGTPRTTGCPAAPAHHLGRAAQFERAGELAFAVRGGQEPVASGCPAGSGNKVGARSTDLRLIDFSPVPPDPGTIVPQNGRQGLGRFRGDRRDLRADRGAFPWRAFDFQGARHPADALAHRLESEAVPVLAPRFPGGEADAVVADVQQHHIVRIGQCEAEAGRAGVFSRVGQGFLCHAVESDLEFGQ